jgi:hypothetical protein
MNRPITHLELNPAAAIDLLCGAIAVLAIMVVADIQFARNTVPRSRPVAVIAVSIRHPNRPFDIKIQDYERRALAVEAEGDRS